MEVKTFILLLVWLIVAIGTVEVSFAMISASDTLANVIGIILLIVGIFVSLKTNCFTKFNRIKNEKRD
jgi:formate-dependent nitrite reductase membrane component NrfD